MQGVQGEGSPASQSLHSKFSGMRMEKDSWQMFIGREVSLGLL